MVVEQQTEKGTLLIQSSERLHSRGNVCLQKQAQYCQSAILRFLKKKGKKKKKFAIQETNGIVLMFTFD